ncbi:hypothetical protein D9757_008160 [Collybiopsis confluens]|uniref:Uncharacterized protein n=1 Tax=Collybiopsis confluens TaxID=2823264 RepID=A0A8H5HDT9_9AGAR|nr:hypothetical protein D9757_008160 [Collybiopsis confluens]
MNRRPSSIPWNAMAVVDITTASEYGPPGARIHGSKSYLTCVLVKNGHYLLVQCPFFKVMPVDEFNTLPRHARLRVLREEAEMDVIRLRQVAAVIDTINFDQFHFAVLVTDETVGPLRLVGQAVDDRIKAPSEEWIPRVPEYELEFLEWENDKIRCVWQDKHVDFYTTLAFVRRWMTPHIINMLYQMEKHGLDITPEALAFITRRGEIVGIIVETIEGELLEKGDRGLLSHAIAELHRSGIVYQAQINDTTVRIHDKKLRFISGLHCFVDHKFLKPSEIDEYESMTWSEVKQFFDALPRDPGLYCRKIARRRPTIINYPVSPEHLVVEIEFLLPSFNSSSFVDHLAKKIGQTKKKKKVQHKTPIKPESGRLLLSDSSGASTSRVVALRKTSFHPYRGINGSRRTVLLLSDHDDSRASDASAVAFEDLEFSGVSRTRARAFSIDSDQTVVGMVDDDEERWKENSKTFW